MICMGDCLRIVYQQPGARIESAPMTNAHHLLRTCEVCGKIFPERNVVSGEMVRKEFAAEIRKYIPSWSRESFICQEDLAKCRGTYVHSLREQFGRDGPALGRVLSR